MGEGVTKGYIQLNAKYVALHFAFMSMNETEIREKQRSKNKRKYILLIKNWHTLFPIIMVLYGF